MKKILLLLSALILVACNTTKSIEKQINYGNYDNAILNTLRKLDGNKLRKNKQKAIMLLERAFNKATERDLNTIDLLIKDANPENLERIFTTYQSLRIRQERIKPILPLYYNGSKVNFNFKNYTNRIVDYKNQTSDYLYTKALTLLHTKDKFNARQAYDDFKYIDGINPNYRDVRDRIEEALSQGQDYILMSLENDTRQVIPARLENELLNISTYGLNDLWTVYHNNKIPKVKYDYNMSLIFKDIIISPEQIKDREIIKEKLVKDGYKYVLDTNGNVKKDSLGNDIKEDKYKKVSCQYFETRQLKTSTVTAVVKFKDLKNQQILDRFPIESTFLFEHFYATYRGDKRALENAFLDYIDNRHIPFPSTEQMIYDTGEDLKLKLKAIITNHNF
jgi:hypothetical protein